MLVRMLYLSRSVGPQTTTMTSSILATAQAFNVENGVTGVLCQGQGFFIQALEGQRSVVNQLYRRIVLDPRHKDVEVMLLDDIDTRRFGRWSMAHVLLSDRDPRVQMQHPDFDPYATPGRVLLARLDELIASGHPIQNVVA
jgi:Sensors of blue-light using FAD